MPKSFADLLGHFVQRSHYSIGQVAALAGLPRRTVANWLGYMVRKPQQWQGVVRVAAALRLDEAETSQLLAAAGHPSLAELRQTITGSERDLLQPWPQPASVPFQAIADLPYFVGREQALSAVGDVLLRGRHVAICNLHGMGGVGKTSLAAHLAYRLRPFFPDGVLWARLDTSDTLSILQAFAAAYGADVSRYHDVDSCAAAVRSILADKQVLIILDNAEKSQQVRPLLPPTIGKTAVILTTRHDLAVADQMHRFAIESFDPAGGESLALFASFLGQGTVQAWRNSLQNIADLLGHLPLAIAIAAGRLANGRLSIAQFWQQLQQDERRLDVLIREDRSVRLSFDLSYQRLSPEQQRFFAALGTFGGDDFGVTAVAYVTDTTPTTVQTTLDELVGLSLVQPGQPGRYRLHPLLHDYAQEKLTEKRPYTRMVTYFVDYTSNHHRKYVWLKQELSNILAALDTAVAYQMNETFVRGVVNLALYLELCSQHALCQRYLNQAQQICRESGDEAQLAAILFHLGNLAIKTGRQQEGESRFLEAITLAVKQQDHDIYLKSLSMLASIAISRGQPKQAQVRWQAGLHLADQVNQPRMRLIFRINLGYLAAETGHYREAERLYREALHISETSTDHTDETITAVLLANLGAQAFIHGHYQEAETYYKQGMQIARQINDRKRICRLLVNNGMLAFAQGRFEPAETFYRQALEIARQDENPRNQAFALVQLGQLLGERGDYAQAEQCLQEGQAIAQAGGYQEFVVSAQVHSGVVAGRQQLYAQAVALLEESLTQARRQALFEQISASLYFLGLVHLEQHQPDKAEAFLQEALQLAQEQEIKEFTARTLLALAQVAAAQNRFKAAHHQARTSLELFEQMGHRSTVTVRAWLSTLSEVDKNYIPIMQV